MQGPPPQMMPPQMPPNQGAMMMQPQVAPQQDAPKKPQMPQNPMNLTDEQMQAVMVAFAASVAFSNPVQEKLGTTIPNFLVDGSVAPRDLLCPVWRLPSCSISFSVSWLVPKSLQG